MDLEFWPAPLVLVCVSFDDDAVAAMQPVDPFPISIKMALLSVHASCRFAYLRKGTYGSAENKASSGTSSGMIDGGHRRGHALAIDVQG